MNDQNIASFLYFGYVPYVSQQLEQQPWARPAAEWRHSRFQTLDEPALIDESVRAFKASFLEPGEGPHVILLSGGLDSRAILAELLELGLRDQIIGVTYGTPGTQDYDLGQAIARKAGVRHEALDLKKVTISHELLDRTAREVGFWMWLWDALYNRYVCWQFGTQVTYWSGTLGGCFTDRERLPPTPHDTWEDALSWFATASLTLLSESEVLSPPGFNPVDVLPREPLLEPEALSYDEQLKYTFSGLGHALPLLLAEGYRFRAPFICPAWVQFNLNLARRHLEDKYLYRKMLPQAYPELFALPTKDRLGLPLGAPPWRYFVERARSAARVRARRLAPRLPWKTLPGVKYVDFDRALRTREDFRTVTYECIEALAQRGVVDWIDVRAMWDDHQRWRADHGLALTLLASLEVNLRNEVPPTPTEDVRR
jgi:hypothetical protein